MLPSFGRGPQAGPDVQAARRQIEAGAKPGHAALFETGDWPRCCDGDDGCCGVFSVAVRAAGPDFLRDAPACRKLACVVANLVIVAAGEVWSGLLHEPDERGCVSWGRGEFFGSVWIGNAGAGGTAGCRMGSGFTPGFILLDGSTT